MGDGFLGKCRECTKTDSKSYARTPRGKLTHKKALRRQIEIHPEKKSATTTLGNAVRDGKITKMPCAKCGDPRSEAHHEDYSKPLDVIWLCKKHHWMVHEEKRKACV
jgi:hypothetical protein